MSDTVYLHWPKGREHRLLSFITNLPFLSVRQYHGCRSVLSLETVHRSQLKQCRSPAPLPHNSSKMLTRLTRLTTMSSHVVGGLSHYWDGQTAPNVAKVSEKSHRGISHDHGHYCVNNLADTLSSSLISDDPFFGATALEGRSELWDLPIRSIVKEEYPEVKEELDLGGRFTPESGLPWYERFDPALNIPDSREPSPRWSQPTDLLPPSETFDNNDLQAFGGSWSFPTFGDNCVGNEGLLGPQEPWSKIDFRLEDEPPRPPSELSEDDGRSDSSSPTLSSLSPPPEPCPPQTRSTPKKNLMDIMKETLTVPEAPRTRSLRHKTSPMAAYFASESAREEKPKVRGIVVKPYVDAATYRRRVMNRESARKYRAKKRKEKINVKRYMLDLEKKNVDLKVSVVGLEKEIAYMKKQLSKCSKA